MKMKEKRDGRWFLMNGFAKRTEQKKQAIKQTVLELLRTSDPRGMTIQMIAKQANVSPVTIYNYFGSKEHLVRETLIDYMIRQVEEYEAFLKEDRSFAEKVKYIIFQKKKVLGEIQVDFIHRLIKEDDEFRRSVDVLYETRVLPLVIEMIREAQENGEIAPYLSIDTLLLYLNLWRDVSEKIPVSLYSERLIDELLLLFFYGVKGEQER